MVEPATSPVIKQPETMDFPEAMRKVIEGKKVTRLGWNDRNVYGLLKDTFLMLHIRNEFHAWTVSEGDLLAEDWVTV